MVKRMPSHVFLIILLSVGLGVSPLSHTQSYETVNGTVVAYDRVSSVGLPDAPGKLYLIIRVAASDESYKGSPYIRVLYLEHHKKSPWAIVNSKRSWHFRLRRDVDCAPIKEFTYIVFNGRYAVDLPRWGFILEEEEARIPFNETLPCYTLKAGDVKPNESK